MLGLANGLPKVYVDSLPPCVHQSSLSLFQIGQVCEILFPTHKVMLTIPYQSLPFHMLVDPFPQILLQ